jgi:hypothetical protein
LAAASVKRYRFHIFAASTPSPFNSATNPESRKRLANSLGTSRPLVSLFGAPV